MRAVLALVLSCIAGAALLAHPAGASGAPSFTGSCNLSGTETFRPPLALVARPAGATVVAQGSCSGTLVDGDGVARALSHAAVRYEQATTASTMSCAGGVA